MAVSRSLPALSDFSSILIIKPSSLGDVVHALPVVHELATGHPSAPIRWLVQSTWAPLLSGHPHLRETIEFPRQTFRGIAGPWRFWQWSTALGNLHREVPELIIDLQGLFRSGLIARRRDSRFVIGLSDSREGARWFHDRIIPVNAKAHAVDRYLTVIDALGLPLPTQPVFSLPAGTVGPWSERLPQQPFCVLHPWSRGKGKALDNPSIEAFCEAIAPVPIVVVGMKPKDLDSPRFPSHVLDLSGQTDLPGLIHLLRLAAWVVSVDSGPMHMAAALHGRVLGIHTWTDPRMVGPYHSDAIVWKAGYFRHFRDFSDQEAAIDQQPTPADLEKIASWTIDRIARP